MTVDLSHLGEPLVYLVTQSMHYYPRDGTGDWVLVTPYPDEAERCFATLDNEHMKAKFIIAIGPQDWEVMAEKSDG